MRSIISINDFSRDEILDLISDALERKNGKQSERFNGVLASLFYESSTRTRESTERAAERLGLRVMGFSGTEGTSVQKGEPLADTVRMYQSYGASVVVMRHPLEGAARFAADLLQIPVINGGDGSNSHPTQTLIDLMTIVEKCGRIDGLKIALVGDLKYGRTVHSLVTGLRMFQNISLWLVAPDSLKMPQHFIDNFERNGSTIYHTQDMSDIFDQVDVIYMTRIQRERFPQGYEGEFEFEKVSRLYQLTADCVRQKKAGIMHPLPRYKHRIEISLDVDQLLNAWYIEQARNGLFLREALLAQILSGKLCKRAEVNGADEKLWKDLPITNGAKTGQHMIYRLDNGTLIDHIHGGKGRDVLNVLRMGSATFVHASNIRSQRSGIKDVLGFTDHELTDMELSKIALVEPDATINIIRDRRVVRKGKVVLPHVIEKLVVCQNPRCITHESQHEFAPQRFIPIAQDILKCYYCEVPVEREKIKLTQ